MPADIENIDRDIDQQLTAMVSGLDLAILRAVQDPLSFGDEESAPLAPLNHACAQLLKLSTEVKTPVSPAREDLIWQVRARAGRLQMLLDSATRFYSSCFSCFAPVHSDYSAHGGWNEASYSSHLLIDC